ncbi:MAG: glycosyltransferase [Candidatus Omnitrophica bacterium]|nr:glycosyltransferase [Candidatus Omnitrophota bacterium]
MLFDAFADLKKDDNDVMLVIAGDGVEKERLICRIKKEKIGNIIFLGGVPHSRLPDLMNCGNLFVLPSLWEGMPIVLLEALACGIPCVATNVGQVSDIMKNGVNGYVVNSRDRVIMKKYISIVLKGNRISSDECRKSVMQYSSERVIRRIEEFYNSVI